MSEKILRLQRLDEYEVDGLPFKKNIPVKVCEELADRLLQTGNFADITNEFAEDESGVIVASRHQACGIIDYSTRHVDNADKARLFPDLGYVEEDAILAAMSDRWSKPVIDECPGFRYWEMDERRKMNRPDNTCGYQQRAFDFYWSIRTLLAGGLTLGVGANPVAGPGVFGTDLFVKGETPHQGRYGIYETNPHMRMDGQEIYPFPDGVFQCVQSNHVIEHFDRPWAAISEMMRVVEPGGHVCLITPDMAYNDRPWPTRGYKGIDPTHRYEFAADQFYEELYEHEAWLPPFELVEFNTLDNRFSFNAVIKRTGE